MKSEFTLVRRAAVGLLTFLCVSLAASAQTRWAIQDDGGIAWTVKRGEAHQDHVEMSGQQVSVIVTYGVDQSGAFALKRHVVWPMLRFAPNKTKDHLALEFGEESSPRIFLNRGVPRNVTASRVRQKGILRAEGVMGRNKEIAWTRSVFPSTDKAAVIEKNVFVNQSRQDVTIEVEDAERSVRTNPERGVYGGYVATANVIGAGEKVLKPGESMSYAVIVSARKISEPPLTIDVDADEKARAARVNDFLAKLQLETPDRVLDTAFAFAKIRATESIFLTKGGLMHGPGGGAYYAAIWANDQAEYANPFFAFLGDDIAAESAMNSFRHFARFMNPNYKPIPSSIISEGASHWNGAKDRGDMAMIAYGAARYALTCGRKDTAEELWPLIEWCLEYCRRKVNAQGVVASDSDELENRFPAGDANLCTASLYYDALNSAALLGRELGKPQAQVDQYSAQARALRTAIEAHFGAKVEGFDTYRYYDGNDVLRAWICIPLTVDIFNRTEGTIQALFSPRLWTPDGLATQAGKETFWDRSTLYALRGVFAAGATGKGMEYLSYYSQRRLLGDHVPYPVEAYPEGNQRHLSAESALYCRIYIEGLFGIRPTGLRSFKCTPRLPNEWSTMKLSKIHAFGNVFDLVVSREGKQLKIEAMRDGRTVQAQFIEEDGTAEVVL